MRISAIGRTLGARIGWMALASAALGCAPKPSAENHFYDRHIQPIFNTFCVGNTSPCHKIDDQTHTALGNLDLTSFEAVQKRKDVLRTYGSYPQPLMLLKALPEESIQIPYGDKQYVSEIRHAGGKPIAANSDAYYQLKRWLENGANRDGVSPDFEPRQGFGPCNSGLPAQRITVDTSSAAYQTFVDGGIQDFFMSSCAYGSCHSSPQADFYLTCPDDPDHEQFNYAQAAGFVAQMGKPVEQSEILLRPLTPRAGGVSHTGGVFFNSLDDGMWKTIRDWALQVQEAPLEPLVKTAGETFFEENVMPKMLQRGCALEGCHSPDGFNDFRLRSGAFGFFAPLALKRNYEALKTEFMAFDTVDIRQSRAVKKNIAVNEGGTVHRAGPLLEDVGSASDPCPATFNAATNTRAICVFEEWARIERAALLAAGEVSAMPGTIPLAFVSRPPNDDTLLQFDTYRGGADLKLADATVDGSGAVTSVANVRSGLGACSGLAGQDVDVRGPEWSYDSRKLVFAARAGAGSGLDLWQLDVGAGTCSRLTNDNGRMVAGVRVHNFDPVFAPDGTIVFSSSRAGTLTLDTYLPNADLFRVAPGGDFSNPEQMTFLLNSEIGAAFMQDGRVSFTAEKATPGFYQLAGRRMNWDLTDYHPLLAQRAMSPDASNPMEQKSIDYQQATEIREGLDRNFVIVLSDRTAPGGGGALATFNRSIGPFQADRTEITFVRSVSVIDAGNSKGGDGGLYRSPFSLPNGEIMASYAGAAAAPKYDLVAVNEVTGARRALLPPAATSYVEATLGYRRSSRLLFQNLPQLVFGGHAGQDSGDNGVMHFPDAPVLATLLGSNLRTGRNVVDMDRAVALRVYEEHPPPSPMNGTTYSDRSLLGSASFEADRSLKVLIPSHKPLILEFIDGAGKPVLTMTEEHQVTPGEYITPGPPRAVFNPICGGCHGSISGAELDVAVSPDALTSASVSMSRYLLPKSLQ